MSLRHCRHTGEIDFIMTSDQARQRAEKSFRSEERTRDARKAMAEYETQAIATRKKTAHLRALRLANEAQGLDSKPNR
jgi:nicotinamide mononucleotide adenylyltransferase